MKDPAKPIMLILLALITLCLAYATGFLLGKTTSRNVYETEITRLELKLATCEQSKLSGVQLDLMKLEFAQEQTRYMLVDLEWRKITSRRYTALPTRLVEKICGCQFEPSDCAIQDGSYLRAEGGLCAKFYWLEDGTTGDFIDLSSRVAIKKYFGEIDTAQKAVTLVALSNSDLELNGDLISGYYAYDQNTANYYVLVIYNNTFGCGIHDPLQRVFSVSEYGEIERVAWENEREPLPGEAIMCVD